MNGARYAFLEEIVNLIEQGEDIVIVSADYAAPVFDDFKVKYPDRFVSVGIAEQNLIQVSAGLALAKKKVIAYAMAPFPCTRAFDQIRNLVSLMNLPVSIVVAGVGFAIPEFGATHYNIEDLSLMQTLPNIGILNITDNTMATEAAKYLVNSDKPLYIRFDKYSEGKIYNIDKIDFSKGYSVLSHGTKIGIISYGYYINRLLSLKKSNHLEDIKIIDLFNLSFDKEQFLKEISELENLLIIEEHVYSGSVGSTILKFVNDNSLTVKIDFMNINLAGTYTNLFGSREFFIDYYKLSDSDILTKIATF